MTLSGKRIIVASQVFVILAFFAGMMMNYYSLKPIIDVGETDRITSAMDEYFMNFYPEIGYDVMNKEQLDSAAATIAPPFDSEVIICSGSGDVFYSTREFSGNAFPFIGEKYGSVAANWVNYKLAHPDDKYRLKYDKTVKFSFYASYLPDSNLLYFSAIDYRISGSDTLRTFYFLLLFMAIGGTLVSIVCYLTIRKIFGQIHRESLTEKELETASAIQKSMLPRGEKHLITLDLDAKLIPAKKVGGDYFCYILVDGMLYFCIGDVSGKGVPASLFMSKAVTLFRSCASSGMKIPKMAAHINRELCINNDMNMFVTAIVGSVRVYDGMISYVNAGHESPVIWDGKDNSKPTFLKSASDNIPFGVMEDVEYIEEFYEMERNGLVVLYTDGISEAKSASKGYIGRSSLLDLVDGLKSRTSKEINAGLIEYVKSYEKGIEQSDDITLLTFKNTMTPKCLHLKNSISSLKQLPEFTEGIFKECRVAQNERILVRAGLDEALTNCVLYAYDEPGQDIDVTTSIIDSCLHFEIKDGGKAFNPLEYNKQRDELQVGGLGISIYKANFDEVLYRRENENNILTLIKKL